MTPQEINAAIEKRFWKKVAVSKNDGCWVWTGAQTSSGYGQFWNGKRNMVAHWFLLSEKPTNGKEACHTCDNRLCVRPSHIFLGSRSDNMQDCVAKGRLRFQKGLFAAKGKRKIWHKGTANHMAVLTEEQVAMVKSTTKAYGLGVAFANHFGVSQTVISGIWSGKRWSHIVPNDADAKRCEAFLKTHGKWKDE